MEAIHEDCIADEAYTEQAQCESVDLPDLELLAIPGETITFDKNKIRTYSVYIDCLLGQLKVFHNSALYPVSLYHTDDADYLGRSYTDDLQSIRKLSALGITNDSIFRFCQLVDGTYVVRRNPSVIPVFHRDDPRFQEWFEKEYKIKYKKKTNSIIMIWMSTLH